MATDFALGQTLRVRRVMPECPVCDQVLAEVRHLRAELKAIRSLLELRRGSRDQADTDLVAAIANVLRHRPFTTRHVLQLAEVDRALHDALENADITNARELGHTLKRLAGVPVGGFRVVRVDEDHRDGIVWKIVVCELCEI